ncbi:guanine nucleotide exchange factor [Mycena vulgaris]|nr:guanine nucleotide exchange factor [Mycena vulgaris]
MTTLLQQYHAVSSTGIQPVLNAIVTAQPSTVDQPSRSELIQLLLTDLKAAKGRISSKDAALALLAVKTLGRGETGSEVLGAAPNLSTLLGLVASLKDNPEASDEALRCIANALLLIERARPVFISKEVNGGETCVILLQRATDPDRIFILSRILFLLTIHPSSFITHLVEGKWDGQTGIEIIGGKLDLLIASLLSGTKMWPEAMGDVLKFTFNILIHYPKSLDGAPDENEVGDNWSPNLDLILPPLLRVFHALPPTSPAPVAAPLTHVIHSLIAIPVSPTLHDDWFGSSLLLSGSSSPPAVADTLLRAHSLLEIAFSHYFPGAVDPDDASVRELAKAEAGPRAASESLDDECSPLDDALSPLVALITRLCIANEVSRTRTRDWLCPAGLDRSAAAGTLESRVDLLGRCLRLLGSVYHVRLKDSVGEMLFAMCDSDAATLSTLFGYGNVAGFLFHKGIVNAPPPPAASASTSAAMSAAAAANINPITGTAQEARAPAPEMTDEEKEREMERLFVLFDRLERTGALPANQNPVRRAIEKAATSDSAPVPVDSDDDDE